jgi:hypothetical protein
MTPLPWRPTTPANGPRPAVGLGIGTALTPGSATAAVLTAGNVGGGVTADAANHLGGTDNDRGSKPPTGAARPSAADTTGPAWLTVNGAVVVVNFAAGGMVLTASNGLAMDVINDPADVNVRENDDKTLGRLLHVFNVVRSEVRVLPIPVGDAKPCKACVIGGIGDPAELVVDGGSVNGVSLDAAAELAA